MKLFAPDYYKYFSCIADKCGHSCCVGWEIDIDADTLEYYRSVKGTLGKRMKESISEDGNSPHFVLSENERCPFLDENNLCDIILTLGEDRLCQICSDHPRYRNFFGSRVETGLGLCCEAAAGLILSYRQKTRLVMLDDDGIDTRPDGVEQAFFAAREKLFEAVQNREKTIEGRINDILSICGMKMPLKSDSEWADIFLTLERLDSEWTRRLYILKDSPVSVISWDKNRWDIEFEQLLIYFLYRHMADSLYDGRFKERAAFAVLSVRVIYALFILSNTYTISELAEIVRMYSSEIEYCEENMETLLKVLGEQQTTL